MVNTRRVLIPIGSLEHAKSFVATTGAKLARMSTAKITMMLQSLLHHVASSQMRNKAENAITHHLDFFRAPLRSGMDLTIAAFSPASTWRVCCRDFRSSSTALMPPERAVRSSSTL